MSSSRSGRNSCSGGSISRIVTGRPSIAREDLDEVGALQRQQRVECRLALASSAGQDQALDQLTPRAEEHVLGPAQADPAAPKRRARAASLGRVGVGAHAQPADACRRGQEPVHGRHDGIVGRDLAPSKYCTTGEGRDRHLAAVDPAGVPSTEITSPSSQHDAAATVTVPASSSIVEAVGAADAGLAHAAGHDGGVRGLAAVAGQDALSGDHARQVVGVGLPRTRITGSPSAASRCVAESSTMRPTAAPGEAATPSGDQLVAPGTPRTTGTSAGPAARR